MTAKRQNRTPVVLKHNTEDAAVRAPLNDSYFRIAQTTNAYQYRITKVVISTINDSNVDNDLNWWRLQVDPGSGSAYDVITPQVSIQDGTARRNRQEKVIATDFIVPVNSELNLVPFGNANLGEAFSTSVVCYGEKIPVLPYGVEGPIHAGDRPTGTTETALIANTGTAKLQIVRLGFEGFGTAGASIRFFGFKSGDTDREILTIHSDSDLFVDKKSLWAPINITLDAGYGLSYQCSGFENRCGVYGAAFIDGANKFHAHHYTGLPV